MRYLLILPVLFGAIVACNTSTLNHPGASSDPNSPVAKAVDTLTTALFDSQQPAVNSAVAQLPPEAQALVQAAYVALEEAVKSAEGVALKHLTVDPNACTHAVSADLASVAKILGDTIHEPGIGAILSGP